MEESECVRIGSGVECVYSVLHTAASEPEDVEVALAKEIVADRRMLVRRWRTTSIVRVQGYF